uniref:EGF-like domain-containing protein n=1 Tax=Heligmosomoides polygyrus TaxID=6339 RepID=A0A183F2W0_HELPZ
LGREVNMANDLAPELGRRKRVAWGAFKSVEEVAKKTKNGYDISIFYPAILHLFTATAPAATVADSKPLPRDFQVNVYTLGDGTTLPANADLVSHQRQTSGRNIPITVDGTAKDCSKSAVFSFFVEDVATLLVINVVGAGVEGPDMVLLTSDEPKIANSSSKSVTLKEKIGGQVDLTKEVVFTDKNTITISIDPSAFALLAFPWSMTVKTTAGPCYAQVRVVSPIVVIPGFSSNATTDFPADFPFTSRGSDNRTYAAFRVSSDDVTVEKASFGSSDPAQPWNDVRTLLWVQANLRDASCSYQFVTSIFQMTSSPTVRIEVSGHTQSNFYFQRTFFFSQADKTATTCSGGRLNQFGECVCPAGYTGEFCDEPVCSNGGTRSTSICVCSTGFYGQLCNSQHYLQSNAILFPNGLKKLSENSDLITNTKSPAVCHHDDVSG